ncbi:MAG: hypothetical protein ACRD1P_12275 [Thermoanaerobaculia bacterium]
MIAEPVVEELIRKVGMQGFVAKEENGESRETHEPTRDVDENREEEQAGLEPLEWLGGASQAASQLSG